MISNLKEIFAYRILVWSLVEKQLKARYRGSILGFLWTFLNPLLLMIVYTLVFSLFTRSQIKPYPVYVFCGLLPWLWFSSTVLDGANSIIGGGTLITKALFPPQILPVVITIAGLINFLLCLPLLFVFMFFFKMKLAAPALVVPAIFMIQFVFSLGIAIGVSAINVHYRDIQHILANCLTLWFFLCPILYSPEDVRNVSEWLYVFIVKLNPMSVFTLAYQDVFFWGRLPNWTALGVLFLLSILMMIFGNAIFQNFRDTFAEEI